MGQPDILEKLPGALARAENLPSPPTVALEVLRLANDADTSIEQLAEVLGRDPVLAGKLLKLANSAMFRRGDEVASLEQASMRLGMKAVKLMALSFSLSSNLPRKGETGGFDYFGYWRRSLTMGVAGRALARLVRSPHGDEAFLCGLMGRLGQLVMAECIPEAYAAVLERSEEKLPDAPQESEALGFDFHQVGAALLREWQLPELIWQTVRHWGAPQDAPAKKLRELARVMHLADRTAELICSASKGSALQALHRHGAELCGISDAELDAFVLSLEGDVADMASMLNVDVDQDSYGEILDRARLEMVQISLGTARDLEETVTRADALEKQNRELETRATTDRLTGIPNRAYFDHTLERVVAARLAGENENALGVIMLDVDHFKKFNDTYGHPVGDEVLKLVADCVKAATRDTDIAARYGGEEFVVVVPNTTLEILETVTERIRERIANTHLEQPGRKLSVTASVGGACVERVRSRDDGPALLALADACLYQAKNAGRNRTVCQRVETTSATS